MKIESVHIKNFRCFEDETIHFDNFTCLIGRNASGKSTVYSALNVFFRNNKDSNTDLLNLTADDFHHNGISKPIEIIVTFNDLSPLAIKKLGHYVRQDKLIVTAKAEYDASTEKAAVKQFGSRLGIVAFSKYFKLEKSGVGAADLKDLYRKLREEYTDLPIANTKPAMKEELFKYESERPKKCVPIPSQDEFYGYRGTSILEEFIQWIFIPASKNIPEESEENKSSALGQLLARTVRQKIDFKGNIKTLKDNALIEYQNLLDTEQSTLDSISQSLQNRLQFWSNPTIKAKILWKKDPDKSVRVDEPTAFIKIGERNFEGELQRFGHGLQRSLMLALLQELNESDKDRINSLIICIEEPEIYQHPPKARYLAKTLYELSLNSYQIMLCSHSPLFISSENFESIRIVRETGKPSKSIAKGVKYRDLAQLLEISDESNLKESGMLAKLNPTLNPLINEMFFCKTLVLVEGISDMAYIHSYLLLTNQIDNFRKNGCHIVQTSGKNKLIKPIALANLFEIPVFIVFDADTNSKEKYIEKHKNDNRIILKLSNNSDVSEWPEDTIWRKNLVMWHTDIEDVIKTDFGDEWVKYYNIANSKYDNVGDLDKNPLAIGYTLELAWKDGIKSSILEELINQIIEFSN